MSDKEKATEARTESGTCVDCQEQKDELMALESIFSDQPDQLQYAIKEEGEHTSIDGSICVHLPKLDRTITVRATDCKGTKEVEVNYLPPLTLTFDLPYDYPSSSAPRFSIRAAWIGRTEREQLCTSLKNCWYDYPGMPILFTWIQTLQEEATKFLADKSKIDLDQIDQEEEACSSEKRMREMSDYEERATQNDFEKGWYDCEVCFDSKSGKESIKFMPCGHIFCVECVSAYYRQRLRDAAVKRLECLREGCESGATQAQLKLALSEDEYERYDSLLLAGTLDLMSDVVICPRIACGAHVLLDAEQLSGTSLTPNLGRCPICHYTFCIICKKTYHGLEPCAIDAGMREELLTQYEKASEAEREEMIKRFGGRKRLEKQIEALKNDRWLESNSKPCPTCRIKIEKRDGCNKMHCAKCNGNFCWLCGRVLNKNAPYDHFNVPGSSNCFNRLFEGITDSDSDEGDDNNWIPFAVEEDNLDDIEFH